MAILTIMSIGLLMLGLVDVASMQIINIQAGSSIEVLLKFGESHLTRKYLHASTANGTVYLSHATTGQYSGTRWRLTNEGGYYTFENLGTPKSNVYRFLQGIAWNGRVLLTYGSTETHKETHWAISGTDDGGYTITWLGDNISHLNLHGNVENENQVSLTNTLFRWQIVSACSSRYLGPMRTTVSGKTCQSWSANFPHQRRFGIGTRPEDFPDYSIASARNYCRDPDNSGYLWCYTTDPNTRWEKCDIDACGCVSTTEKKSDKTTTISGQKCMRWDKQYPHAHTLGTKDTEFADGSVSAAGNYCRDPDNSGFLWCYTTNQNPKMRWERCDVETCVAVSTPHNNNQWWDTWKCGRTKYRSASDNQDAKIIGGNNARHHEIPWQVLINPNGRECGGVIISPYWVLTAAHCTVGGDMQVLVGLHDRKAPTSQTHMHIVKSVYTHHRYSQRTLNYDVALLRLHNPIKFTDDITAVCPPSGSDVTLYTNSLARISGWGHTVFNDTKSSSDVLKVAEVNVIDVQQCKASYPDQLTDKMVCAGKGTFTQIDTCQGDSGGPMTVKRQATDQHDLVGLTSWGDMCASSFPGVYTNIPSMKSWITSILREYQPVGSKYMP